MKEYKIPNEYHFRLHHIRPRFKGNVENVLLYMATEISKLPASSAEVFNKLLNKAIRRYPGNLIKTTKTIDNWRTEISALFAFFIERNDGITIPGKRAKELAEKQDLVEMFKKFLFLFQYPGAYVKPYKVSEMVKAGIHFKPAQFILKVFQAGEKATGDCIFLTKDEVCHCILYDLRCTRDNEDPYLTWERIILNRESKVKYDKKGDITRYAGDILDYMEIANLITKDNNRRFYLNKLENEVITKFIESDLWFDGYDTIISKRAADLSIIKNNVEKWFNYANMELDEADFKTDVLAFISTDSDEYYALKEASLKDFNDSLGNEAGVVDTKAIGDMGENLVHAHERQRVKNGGRKDLIHLIKKIPSHFALGYDINSVELDEKKRYIEVKTTISSEPLNFERFHMTTNEWNAAETNKDRYYIYRLKLSKHSQKLFIIQDPVGLYKKDIVQMIPRDGADIIFKENEATGKEEELLKWEN